MIDTRFRPKLDDKQRRALVQEVAAGLDVNRAAEKYGVQPPSVWNLVIRAAFRDAMRDIGLPGMRADEYLRLKAATEALVGNAAGGAPSQHDTSNAELVRRLKEAAAKAAAALQELATAAVA
jgi:hypothetical protein